LGYTLNIAGGRVASDRSREFALDAVAALHENLLSEATQARLQGSNHESE
jgi:hypothetical protein